MNSDNIIRLFDVGLIGPMNIIFAFSLPKSNWLFWITLLFGIATVIYNWINFKRFYYKGKDSVLIKFFPKTVRDLLWDPINGKTQLLRVFNLAVMYPLLVYALIQSNPSTLLLLISKWTTAFFVVCGVVYNAYHYNNLRKS
jgi:hypothetical protein